MPSTKSRSLLGALLAAVFGFLTLEAPLLAASEEKVLHTFNLTQTSKDGAWPYASLIFDAAGNLYGTTYYGGATNTCENSGCGTVFQLRPGTNGKWKEKVVHTFKYNRKDGVYPQSSLVFDAAGNLYGTTYAGGSANSCQNLGCGIVFKLTPGAGGTWTETVLHNFSWNDEDGFNPMAGLIFDGAGNLYGTTSAGGSYGEGTVFELTPQAGGTWTETVLHSFAGGSSDGASPYAGVIMDATGNLYGTTYAGGGSSFCKISRSSGCGTVFQLAPGAGGTWTETVLYIFPYFRSATGSHPYAGLISDAMGNLYGTTVNGGGHGYGSVFKLTPGAGGTWTEKVLHSFNDDDGDAPYGSLIFDAAGNLYGTTSGGARAVGSVFKLLPGADGKWTEKVVHSFSSEGGGWNPHASLIFDAAGNLYGTTLDGGAYNDGTVFEITP
jgi:uncharacterized repeat protein (TIGR03803 family)